MRRRDLIAFACVATGCPHAVIAQQAVTARVGVLSAFRRAVARSELQEALYRGFSDRGYEEGRNLAVEFRYAEDDYARMSALAAALAQSGVSVIIIPNGLPTARSVIAATGRIPIVFLTSEDPVNAGLVASLNRPGGKLTGVMALGTPLVGKQIELLSEIRPGVAPIVVLDNPQDSRLDFAGAAEAAGQRLRRRVIMANVVTESEFEAAFVLAMSERAAGIVVPTRPLFSPNPRHEQLAALATRYAIPAVFTGGNLAVSGGLMSYGPSLPEMLRQLGVLAGKILAGADVADLPVEEPARIELKINLRAAEALGIEIPGSLIARADEVIE